MYIVIKYGVKLFKYICNALVGVYHNLGKQEIF